MEKRPLPKIRTPEYNTILPLSNKKVVYRPYNVSDERILLQAAASKDEDKEFYITNTLNVIKGLVLNDVNIVTLPAIDVRFLLLHLRAKSVGEEIEFTYDKKPAAANINNFVVINPRKEEDYKIDIGGGIGIVMKDINFADEVEASTEADDPVAVFYKMIIKSVHSIFTEDDVWIVGQDITTDDVEEFIKPIPNTESKKLYDFVTNVPYIAVKAHVLGKEVELNSKEVDFLA